jgi:hypothetical protein
VALATRTKHRRSKTGLGAVLVAFFVISCGVASLAFDPPSAPPSPAPEFSIEPSPSTSESPAGLPLPPVTSPVPTLAPSPSPSPTPAPVALETSTATVPLGHEARVRVLSPASGILLLTVSDPNVAQAVFDSIDRTLDLTGLHAGSATVTAQDQFGQTATLTIAVQPYAGRTAAAAAVTITGDPASSSFVAEMAAAAAVRVAYPTKGANVDAPPSGITDARELPANDTIDVHVPVSITGPNLYPYRQTVTVTVNNLAQPRMPPKFVMVSDFPETITENGTLFYSDVNYDEPARLMYYHYAAAGAPMRRVLVKVQNNGVVSSLIQLTAGIGGPDSNVLQVGHESTKRFLREEAAGEGQIFEVPPHATINIVDQLLPPLSLVTGLMHVRVVEGDGVRIAVVVQDALDSPVGPISDTLLSSAVRHARGVYEVPDFYYDESYTIGDAPTVLNIGKLPLPNLVEGEVLGGDYGVKQSASVTLLNPGDADARVGMWFEPRGGRATGTFVIDGDLVEVHATNPGAFAMLRSFTVPAHGFRLVDVVTMPEGGSSYPVNLLFSSNAPN